jgi:hypothetical protein
MNNPHAMKENTFVPRKGLNYCSLLLLLFLLCLTPLLLAAVKCGCTYGPNCWTYSAKCLSTSQQCVLFCLPEGYGHGNCVPSYSQSSGCTEGEATVYVWIYHGTCSCRGSSDLCCTGYQPYTGMDMDVTCSWADGPCP